MGCSHGVSHFILTQEFLCCTAAYPNPHPPKQIKCLIQTRPLLQPLSGPQGTMPAVIRRQWRWSNTETQAVLLYSDRWWTRAHVWCRRRATVEYTAMNKRLLMTALNYIRGEHKRSQLKATEREYHTKTFPIKHWDKWGISHFRSTALKVINVGNVWNWEIPWNGNKLWKFQQGQQTQIWGGWTLYCMLQ